MKANLLRLSLAMLVLAGTALSVHAEALNWKVLGGGLQASTPINGMVRTSVQTLTLTVTVPGTHIIHNVPFPKIAGLTLNGTGTNPQPHFEDFNFFVTPAHAGVYTIPAFTIRAEDGASFPVSALTLNVHP